MTREPRTTRPGFTVIEVVVALALSSLVVLSAYGVLAMLRRADSSIGSATRQSTELLLAQTTLRRAFSSMVAATPIEAEPDQDDETGTSTGDDDPLAGVPDEMREQIESVLSPSDLGADAGLDDRLAAAVATADTSVPPHFDLYYEDVAGVTLPRLELVVSSSPARFGAAAVRRPTPDDTVSNWRRERERLTAQWSGMMRGVFELVSIEGRGWCLVWQPTAPAGPHVVLIDELASLRWRVLMPLEEDQEASSVDPDEAWQPVHAAYLEQDYPDAVELSFETEDGARAEWRFETIVRTITPEPAP
jgi:prepilin-type N-terminal cleavage/methylation domain-containing protein